MILILSMNTSLDRVLEVEQLTPGNVHRVMKEQWVGGGKALNVLKMLGSMNQSAKAVTVVGNVTGQTIRELLRGENVEDQSTFVSVDDYSRICDVLVDRETGQSTVVNSVGPQLTSEEVDRVTDALRRAFRDGPQYLVLTGSVPPGTPSDFYARIARDASAFGVRTVVDATRESLTATIRERPWLVKVNFGEFMDVVPELRADTGVTLAPASRRWYDPIHPLGAHLAANGTNLVVTHGHHGSAAWTTEGQWAVSAPAVALKNAVGSGDAYLAGFLAQYVESGDFVRALRWAAAAAGSNAQQILPKMGNLDEVHELSHRVQVQGLVEVGERS